MIAIKRRNEHERVKLTRKVRALKHRRSRSTWFNAVTYDKKGRHARREAAWRRECRRLRAQRMHAERRAWRAGVASRRADEAPLMPQAATDMLIEKIHSEGYLSKDYVHPYMTTTALSRALRGVCNKV